jgi:acetoin utilization protein AcuB
MMRLGEIMQTGVKTAGPEEAAETAFQRMRLQKVRHLVVVDKSGGILGVLSDRDLGAGRGEALRRNRRVADLMTRRPITVAPDTSVRQAANLLRGHNIGCVPIVDAGRLVGIVTTSDLLVLIGRGAERPVARVKRWTLAHRAPQRYPRANVR